MNFLRPPAILAAEANRWDDVSSGFRSGFEGRRIEPFELVLGLLIIVGIVLFAWLLSYLLKLQERHRTYSSPFRLFLSLCKAHGLRWREYWWLWRLARSQGLRAPARLFLEPERFATASLSPPLRRRAELLARLRDRLFVELPKKGTNLEELKDDHRPARPGHRTAPQAETPVPPLTAAPALDVPPWTTPSAEANPPAAK
jgi:hypothetical protein